MPSTVDLDLTVLRAAALDDVHVRHDLDAADERRAHPDRQRAAPRAARRRRGCGSAPGRPSARCARRTRARCTACERSRFTTWTTGAFSSTVLADRRRRPARPRRASARSSKTRTCSPTCAVALYATSIARRTSETPADVELRRLVQLVAQLVDEAGLGRVRDRRRRSRTRCGAAGWRATRARAPRGAPRPRLRSGTSRRRSTTSRPNWSASARREVALVEDPGVDEVLTETLARTRPGPSSACLELLVGQERRARRAPHRGACGCCGTVDGRGRDAAAAIAASIRAFAGATRACELRLDLASTLGGRRTRPGRRARPLRRSRRGRAGARPRRRTPRTPCAASLRDFSRPTSASLVRHAARHPDGRSECPTRRTGRGHRL